MNDEPLELDRLWIRREIYLTMKLIVTGHPLELNGHILMLGDLEEFINTWESEYKSPRDLYVSRSIISPREAELLDRFSKRVDFLLALDANSIEEIIETDEWKAIEAAAQEFLRRFGESFAGGADSQ